MGRCVPHLACVCTYVISIVSVYLFAASGAFCGNTNALHNIMVCMSSIWHHGRERALIGPFPSFHSKWPPSWCLPFTWVQDPFKKKTLFWWVFPTRQQFEVEGSQPKTLTNQPPASSYRISATIISSAASGFCLPSSASTGPAPDAKPLSWKEILSTWILRYELWATKNRPGGWNLKPLKGLSLCKWMHVNMIVDQIDYISPDSQIHQIRSISVSRRALKEHINYWIFVAFCKPGVFSRKKWQNKHNSCKYWKHCHILRSNI